MQASEEETELLNFFRIENAELFRKSDRRLFLHLGAVLSLLSLLTFAVVATDEISLKIAGGIVNAFLWFCLINATIHHHHTHHNAARTKFANKILDLLYRMAVPNAPKRRARYTRAHLNHHLRPFHETDVDHHYGTKRYLEMTKSIRKKALYFLELTFVGGHVPGWEDDRYMNQVPLEKWNRADYEKVKAHERKKSARDSAVQWSAFLAVLAAGALIPAEPGWWKYLSSLLRGMAWGWAFPMLLVKNWAHFLGQFQHYDGRFLETGRSLNEKTKTYHVPGWINYLAGGEISGHFLHHLYPEIPYYNVERARARFVKDAGLAAAFVTY